MSIFSKISNMFISLYTRSLKFNDDRRPFFTKKCNIRALSLIFIRPPSQQLIKLFVNITIKHHITIIPFNI